MLSRFSDLRYKEVINVNSGHRLGYVSDLEMDMEEGKLVSLLVPGPSRLGGMLGREDDYILPWGCIRRIGEDIILVDLPTTVPRTRNERSALL